MKIAESILFLHSRKKHFRDLMRFARWLEHRRLLSEAYWDRQRAELVAVHDYPFYGVCRGEVLFDRRGYVNPSLERQKRRKR